MALRIASWATRQISAAVESSMSSTPVDGHGDRHPRGGRGGGQVGERPGQTAGTEVGGVDLHQQGPQGAQAVADGAPGRVEAGAERVRGVRVPGGSGHRERRAGEVLDDAVVQVAGDPAALGVRGLDGREQQPLALLRGGR